MEVKHQKHLLNILNGTDQQHPNFTVFLGAGASVTSGVKAAGGMIEEWRKIFIEMHGEDELQQRHWYDTPKEYSELFESLYDQPSQRRDYIERCIVDAKPSWGYIYLVNLLASKKINTVFTTNFDDLLNEACYTFSDNLRPLVSAHDSSIKSVRLTSNRPKIIKLHGDFLFDNIKNTARELESLENNMRAKFRQYASEFGMIVVGYAGNDRSIMDTLNTLLHTETNFPHGIYWCIRKNTKIEDLPENVRNLARFPRFHLVEIEGFDEFFAEAHQTLGCRLQRQISNPYEALADKLDDFFADEDEGCFSENKVIVRDHERLMDNINRIRSTMILAEKIERLEASLPEEEKQDYTDAVSDLIEDMELITGKQDGRIQLLSLPNMVLSQMAYSNESYDDAISFGFQALNKRGDVFPVSIILKSMSQLGDFGDLDKVHEFLDSVTEISPKESNYINNAAVEMMSKGFYQETEDVLRKIHLCFPEQSDARAFIALNLGVASRLAGKSISADLNEELKEHLRRAGQEANEWLLVGLSIVLELDDTAAQVFESMEEEDLKGFLAEDYPIMKLLSDSLTAQLDKTILERGLYDEVDEVDEVDAISNGVSDPSDKVSTAKEALHEGSQ